MAMAIRILGLAGPGLGSQDYFIHTYGVWSSSVVSFGLEFISRTMWVVTT